MEWKGEGGGGEGRGVLDLPLKYMAILTNGDISKQAHIHIIIQLYTL